MEWNEMVKPNMIPRMGDDPIHQDIKDLETKQHQIRQKQYNSRSEKSIQKWQQEENAIIKDIDALKKKIRVSSGSYYDSDFYGLNPNISGVWGLWGEQEYGGGEEPSRHFFGLADTMGIEGFFIARVDMVESSMKSMRLRAKHANSQRHPYVFIVRLTKSKAKHIAALIENGLYVRAAKYARKQPTFKVITSNSGGDEEILNTLMDIYERRQTANELEMGVLNYLMFNNPNGK
jgi:hypothetical protein